MATARCPRSHARPLAAVLTVCAAAIAAVLPATASDAAKQPTLHQAVARLDSLNKQAEKITERYDGARGQLVQLRKAADAASVKLAQEQAILADLRTKIGKTANAAYREGAFGGDLSELAVLINQTQFVDSSGLIGRVAYVQSQQLQAVATAQQQVAFAQAAAATRVAEVKAAITEIAADKKHIETLLAKARSVVASLSGIDRATYYASAYADAAAMRALRGSYSAHASGRAAQAVRFAYAQLGKPYQYGAAGPGSYDCSGLTMAAWGSAGVSLPHNAAAQQGMLQPVSRGDLRPGDLVFFGSPSYHVGIYIGNGQFIHAPHTGDVVRISFLDGEGGFSGAGRP